MKTNFFHELIKYIIYLFINSRLILRKSRELSRFGKPYRTWKTGNESGGLLVTSLQIPVNGGYPAYTSIPQLQMKRMNICIIKETFTTES